MELPSRKYYKKIVIDTIDDWLREEGYVRKISPKDPTCLFRAVSEQIYKTQYYHIKVRKECVDFMKKNKDLFEKNISISIDDYLDQLSCITEWGGQNEIEAMSILYKKEFIIYNSTKMTKKIVTNNGFDELIYLCHTPPKHYESIYSQKTHAVAAFCQSVVYKLLYEQVFQMPDVDYAVGKMLHEPSQSNSQNKFMLKGNFEVKERSTQVKKLLNQEENRIEIYKTITPFPYRVAKALDPSIYRNIDYDVWLEIKREVRNAGWLRWSNCELQVGGKCLVQLNYDDEKMFNENIKELENDDQNGNVPLKINRLGLKKESVSLVGHIQEMSQNQGPVIVYIEELGEKKTVPYRALKPLQQEPKRNKSFIISPMPPKKHFFDANSKWKKQTNSYARKPRNLVTNPSNIPILNSRVSLDALDNENNNNHVNNGNDSSNSVNVKQIVTSTTNSRFSSEFISTDSTIISRMDAESYSSEQEYCLNNVVEAQLPLSSSNNNDLLINPNFSGEHFGPKSFVPNNKDNNRENLNEKNIKNNLINENNNIPTSETAVPLINDNYCSSSVGSVPAYPANLNLIWVSPEGNVYAPFFYFGNNFMGPSITGMLNCSNLPVNFGAQMSVDSNGNDLPYADITTLRFFYNLGIEYFRCNQAWATNGPPMPCPPPFLTNEENIAPIGIPCNINSPTTSSNESSSQQSDNNVRTQIHSPTLKNERSFNNRMNTKLNGNGRNMYPRKYSQDFHQDTNKNRNDGITASYDYHKSKNSHRNNENRDMNNTPWEYRKNKGAVQFKKPNEDRYRTEKYNCHYENPKKSSSFNNHINNNNNNNNNTNSINNGSSQTEDQKFIQKRKNYDHQISPGQTNGHVPIQPPAITPVSSVNHQFPFNHPSPPVFTGVPYYPNEMENMYPLPGNMYPVSFLSHSDSTEGNNIAPYCCPNLDNYPPPITPIYPPFSSSSLLSSPPPPQPIQPLYPTMVSPNSPENWYIPGQAHFIPYPPNYPIPSSMPPPPLPPQNSASS